MPAMHRSCCLTVHCTWDLPRRCKMPCTSHMLQQFWVLAWHRPIREGIALHALPVHASSFIQEMFWSMRQSDAGIVNFRDGWMCTTLWSQADSHLLHPSCPSLQAIASWAVHMLSDPYKAGCCVLGATSIQSLNVVRIFYVAVVCP